MPLSSVVAVFYGLYISKMHPLNDSDVYREKKDVPRSKIINKEVVPVQQCSSLPGIAKCSAQSVSFILFYFCVSHPAGFDSRYFL